jgi:hypothetical protein
MKSNAGARPGTGCKLLAAAVGQRQLWARGFAALAGCMQAMVGTVAVTRRTRELENRVRLAVPSVYGGEALYRWQREGATTTRQEQPTIRKDNSTDSRQSRFACAI